MRVMEEFFPSGTRKMRFVRLVVGFCWLPDLLESTGVEVLLAF